MSNGYGSMYDLRISEVRSRVNSRLNEISQRSGIQFAELFRTETSASSVSVDTSTSIPAQAILDELESNKTDGILNSLMEQVEAANAATAAQDTAEAAQSGGLTSYSSLIASAAAAYGMDPNLLKAVAKAESNFDSTLVSSAGAIGVMQLMPATAVGLGVDDPYDPQQNIDGGARYLKGQLERFEGDLMMALAAYNAGPGTLNKRSITDLTDEEQYARLPKETQAYIKRVLDYYADYGAQE